MAESKFTPGTSGNPNGRPKNKSAPLMFRRAIAEAMPDIIKMLIDAALSGDVGAATVLLNRCVPAMKCEAQAINLPVKKTLPEQGNEIVKATVTGRIPPDVGSQLITALAAQAKLIELDDLIGRIAALEAKKNEPKTAR
ncbi:MAG: DUF5681 domain-containing protein [Methylococcaceae bacterium]